MRRKGYIAASVPWSSLQTFALSSAAKSWLGGLSDHPADFQALGFKGNDGKGRGNRLFERSASIDRVDAERERICARNAELTSGIKTDFRQ